MVPSLLITLREGLEAALIVSIVLAYLGRTGHRKEFGKVWLGVGAAVLTSLLAGAILFVSVGELSGRAEEIFEGLAMLTAVAVLTYMVIWMKRQAADIKAHLEADVNRALGAASGLALAILAFVAVGREELETVLFLFAAVRTSTPMESVLGGSLGLGIAALLGYLAYKGSHRLNLRWFFNVTGVLLILFAGGLLAQGIHELQEAAVFPVVMEEVWNTNPLLNEKEGLGSFLKAMLGYNGNPELLEVVIYGLYLVVALAYFLRQPASRRKPSQSKSPQPA